jgi:hypothetical protein
MNISIKTIPETEQRYPTTGDYFQSKDGTWNFRISDMGNWKYEFLVALHELVEWALAQHKGITNEQIDDFDFQFEKDRESGLHTDDEEPGNDPKCPVWFEHQMATVVERMIAGLMGIEWKVYDSTVIETALNGGNVAAE